MIVNYNPRTTETFFVVCSGQLDNFSGSNSDGADTRGSIELGERTTSSDKTRISRSSSSASHVANVNSPDYHRGDTNTGKPGQGGSTEELVNNRTDEIMPGDGKGGDSIGGALGGIDGTVGVEEAVEEEAVDEEEEEILPSVVQLMLGDLERATFFGAVLLSGMGVGIIETFLFIR